MSITLNIEEASQLGPGLWTSPLNSQSTSQLAACSSRLDGPSVIFVDTPTYDPKLKRLSFALGAAKVLNLGRKSTAFIIATCSDKKMVETAEPTLNSVRLGLGDREFIAEVEAHAPTLLRAAEEMVRKVRSLSPTGDLLRHDVRNFINSPDNFVALKPQPRVNAIHVVIRGATQSFGGSSLKVKQDQNSYCSFKICRDDEIEEGLRLIGLARRYVQP